MSEQPDMKNSAC